MNGADVTHLESAERTGTKEKTCFITLGLQVQHIL